MGGTAREIRKLDIVYDPLPSQKRFHECKSRFKGFSGPVGSGKSQALCQEALRMTYLNPGRTGLLGAPTYPMLRDATVTTLLEILETNQIRYEYNKGENILTMVDTRSRILFRPVEDFERLRGTNLAWFGLDELTYTPQEAWTRIVARLRDPQAKIPGGFAVWTPKGFDWVYRTFVGPGHTKEYEVIMATPRENRFLAKDYYDNLEHCYDERFYRQEVLGEYLNMTGGLVYDEFRREVHLRDLHLRPLLKVLWALDFNVDPLSSVVVQIKEGTVHVLDEIVLRHGTTKQACANFVELYGQHQYGVEIYGDASGHQERTTGNTDYQIIEECLRAAGVRNVEYLAERSNPKVRDRVVLVNRLLRSAAGESRLFIHPKCEELIKDFEQVAFREDTYDIDKNKDRMRTHVSDALGYVLWEKFKPGGSECGERTDGQLV